MAEKVYCVEGVNVNVWGDPVLAVRTAETRLGLEGALMSDRDIKRHFRKWDNLVIEGPTECLNVVAATVVREKKPRKKTCEFIKVGWMG